MCVNFRQSFINSTKDGVLDKQDLQELKQKAAEVQKADPGSEDAQIANYIIHDLELTKDSTHMTYSLPNEGSSDGTFTLEFDFTPVEKDNGATVEKPEQHSLEIFGGPSSGVVYMNVPIDFKGTWLKSEYEKGATGNHQGLRFNSAIGKLEVLQVAMNKAPGDVNNDMSVVNKHLDILQFGFISAPKKFDTVKVFELGLQSRTKLIYSYNKYEQDYQNQGIDEAKPIKEMYMAVSPEIYAKKDWDLLKSNEKFGAAVQTFAALSPFSYSRFSSNNANRPGEGKVQESTLGMEGSFGVGALLTLKDDAGKDKWALSLSYTQNEAHAYNNNKNSLSQNIIAGKLDYKINDKFTAGIYGDQNRRIMKSTAVNNMSFVVFNNFGVSASMNLGRKKK
jgi:hypothetical protein